MELVSNFIGDSNLHCTYEVVKQTPKTITLLDGAKKFTRKIYWQLDGSGVVFIAGGECIRLGEKGNCIIRLNESRKGE